ncbi:MAG: beta-galactosidase [Gammaproteobacteria bacterium]|nr:beta-galactosidase [Gammaproteobacteria bacterium]
MKLGVCYYPEHWPETLWPAQAKHMSSLGIDVVRIGEFAWSRLEPQRHQFEFQWLERAITCLSEAGLKVVLGTPTATPPRWLIKDHPDMLARDEQGQPRQFGSRRHYCFSYEPYRKECERIVSALVKQFGQHPDVIAWQIDNEYGCHSTILSYSDAATKGFRTWCKQRYSTIEALNAAWGNVFWSMEYSAFDDIALPQQTVTEANPSHRMAFWRYSTDQVVAFNQRQIDILRAHTEVDLLHNYMGNFVEFDHFCVGENLDIASWDNYPIGFLTRDGHDAEQQASFLRTGDPDSSSFHHALYRCVGHNRLWVMEQQPGPVNWAPHNPAPLPGMVRLWGLEAYAHGAEVMSYFRYRQAPFAQEQMHTGLCLPNGEEDLGAREVAQLHRDLTLLTDKKLLINSRDFPSAQVAVVFDYAGDQLQRIQQPLGQHYDPLMFTQRIYAALRQLALEVDIVSEQSDLSGYSLIVLANSTSPKAAFVNHLNTLDATIVLCARTGSKTDELHIPGELPPGAFQQLIDLQVVRSESLPQWHTEIAQHDHLGEISITDWREHCRTGLTPKAQFPDGWGFHYQQNTVHYLNACPTQTSLIQLLEAG